MAFCVLIVQTREIRDNRFTFYVACREKPSVHNFRRTEKATQVRAL